MWHHRAITFLAAAAFFVVPAFGASALDTLQGITPPTLKGTLPSVQTPVVKPNAQAPAIKPSAQAPAIVTSIGIIKKQGMTSYMYGTHVLVNENGRTLYALKSDRIGLDSYVGKKVAVSGELIPGYPVENGPNYLNVGSVRE